MRDFNHHLHRTRPGLPQQGRTATRKARVRRSANADGLQLADALIAAMPSSRYGVVVVCSGL
jgi:hypothetical protein